MSCATKALVSVAGNGGCCLASVSSAKISSLHPYLALPQKPIKFNLSCSHSYSFTPLSVSLLSRKGAKFPTILSAIAAQQQEDDTLVLEQEDDVEEGFDGEFDFGGEDSVEAVPRAGESDGFVEEAEVEGGLREEEYQEPPEEAKLFVGNLPYDVDSEKLAQLLQQAGVVEIAEVIYNRETDQSRGFGFVTMSTVEEAEKAVEMFNRYDFNGRLLTVNKASPRGSRPERAPREFEPAYRIYVGNLPWDVDDGRLEQMFSEHGKVVNARVVYDRESGRSRGFGFVTMSNESEMNDAIANLDGQSLDGRSIRVNAAEERPRRAF